MQKQTNRKPKIGIVLSSVPGYSEIFFRNKIKGLQAHGFEVILFVDYLKSGRSELPFKVVPAVDFSTGLLKSMTNGFFCLLMAFFIHPKRSFKLYSLDEKDKVPFKKRIKNLLLNQFLLSENLDWLHFGFGMLAVDRENVAAAIGAKMGVSFRGYDLYLSPLKHKDCYKKLFLKAVKYHVLCEEMKATLIAYKIFKDQIYVIPPAIDTKMFNYRSHTNKNTVVKLLTVARLHWKKGLDYTLEALVELKHSGIPFHYTIIGDGEERERLIFTAYQLDILEHVTFTGKLPQQAVKEHLEKADVYLQYSIQEGFCNAVLEAQVMGLLCVVSNAEGLQENVLHNKTGWVVTKRRPDLLAQKIKEVINLSNEKKECIRNHAVSRVQKVFNLEKQQQAFFDFYGNSC